MRDLTDAELLAAAKTGYIGPLLESPLLGLRWGRVVNGLPVL